MSDNFGEGLRNTYWYVPTAYLAALQFTPGQSDPFDWASDQTVWHIVEYRDGYFTGKAYLELRFWDTEPSYACRTILGSLTPDGNVYMSFVPDSTGGTALATTGIGRIRRREDQVVFEMQMATGVGSLVAHWAYMEECRPGDEAWERLPGTNVSVPDFIRQCEENS